MRSELGELEPFLRRRSIKELNEAMLEGFLSLSKMEPLVLSSTKLPRVGESVFTGCKSFDSKNGMFSSKESDFGRGMAPFTALASRPLLKKGTSRKSIASFKPPALFRV